MQVTACRAYSAAAGPCQPCRGKSFLLNMLLNSSQGFAVGAKPEPETQGLWLRVLPGEAVVRAADGSRVVLLDTEGFYGEDATRSYDAKIFAVAVLLSSHLIYNNLRTLGDAQSVAALADLAKQAQVFNLHNWLHSSQDWESETAGQPGDPHLQALLQTLDFPPLTWVVQGFDMDLDPQEAPLDHLHRYFAAHAKTGDRSLDTLFTRGISCHALRTPADLNHLREHFGGGGLSADVELVPYLHPAYQEDVQRLRDAVFNNLISKGRGKLTGKAIARLLPLLVHYVSEDFPMNADRTLREVMADLLLDGGYSGGLQYFQSRVERVLPIKQARRASKGQSMLDDLLASALSDNELAKLLTESDAEAVEYCRKRCVGLPKELVAPRCEGQLGTKIERLKPEYRLENDRRVEEAVLQLQKDLQEDAGNELGSLQLPVPEREVDKACKQTVSKALSRYEQGLGKHRRSKAYSGARDKLQAAIRRSCDAVVHENARAVGSLISAGKVAYRAAYLKAMAGSIGQDGEHQDVGQQLQLTVALSPKRLTDAHSAAISLAQAAAEHAIKHAGLPWVGPGQEQYDFQLFQSHQWAKVQLGDFQAKNEELILTFSQQRAARVLEQYKKLTGQTDPFPDNYEAVSAKIDEISRSLVSEYLSAMAQFSGAACLDQGKMELLRDVAERREKILDKNTALMAALCYEPLRAAVADLHLDRCGMKLCNILSSVPGGFWSFRCLCPAPSFFPGFRKDAYKAAQRQLAAAQHEKQGESGFALSMATQDRVIRSWMARDLAQQSNQVLANFASLVTTLAVICGTLAHGFGRMALLVKALQSCRGLAGATPDYVRQGHNDRENSRDPRSKWQRLLPGRGNQGWFESALS
eukprot:SM000410S15567  [mRNA]  locus=s410:12113:15982:+ [translate_table: standard]